MHRLLLYLLILLAPVGLGTSSAQTVERLKLLNVGPKGELADNTGRIDISLATPEIRISKFVPTVKATADGGFQADVEIAGTVRYTSAGVSSEVQMLKIYLNGDARMKDQTVELQVKRTTDPAYPLEGSFSSVVKGVPVTDGNNVVCFAAVDPVSKLSAEAMWAVSFELPYEEEDEGGEEGAKPKTEAQREAKITSAPQEVQAANGVPPIYQSAALSGQGTGLELAFGDVADVWYPLKEGVLPGWLVPMDPATSEPVRFTLIPGGKTPPVDFWADLKSHPDFAALKGRSRFLAAFSQGVFAHGTILSTGGKSYYHRELFSKAAGRCEFPVRIREKGQVRNAVIALPLEFREEKEEALHRLGDLLWIWREMVLKKDPKLDDFEMSLIVGDLSETGLSEEYLNGWTSELMLLGFEVFDATLKQEISADPGAAGFLLGIVVGESIRVAARQSDDGRKVDFLKEMVNRMRAGGL